MHLTFLSYTLKPLWNISVWFSSRKGIRESGRRLLWEVMDVLSRSSSAFSTCHFLLSPSNVENTFASPNESIHRTMPVSGTNLRSSVRSSSDKGLRSGVCLLASEQTYCERCCPFRLGGFDKVHGENLVSVLFSNFLWLWTPNVRVIKLELVLHGFYRIKVAIPNNLQPC